MDSMSRDPSTNDLARNLRLLCSRHRSISEVCRLVGINRQQFDRYLNGDNRPSGHNLHRLAQHFGIPIDDLFLEHGEFAARFGTLPRDSVPSDLVRTITAKVFPGNLASLRRYRGYYHVYHLTPRLPSQIHKALIHLHERDGQVFSKSLERSMPDNFGMPRLSKYVGLAGFLSGYIFVMEFEHLSEDVVTETIMFPAYRAKLDLLTGLTFGMTSEVRRQPFASRVVWKYLGDAPDLRAAIRGCGAFPDTSAKVESRIRRALLGTPGGLLTVESL